LEIIQETSGDVNPFFQIMMPQKVVTRRRFDIDNDLISPQSKENH